MLSLYNSLPEKMSPLRETTSLFSIKNNLLSSETNLTGHTESELVVSFLLSSLGIGKQAKLVRRDPEGRYRLNQVALPRSPRATK